MAPISIVRAAILLVVASGLRATHAAAYPAPTYSGSLKILETETVGNGTLTWYGVASVARRDVDVRLSPRECGSNDVTCDWENNRAQSELCDKLINILIATGSTAVSRSPRSMCYAEGENACCVSWADPMSGPRSDFVPAAQKTYNDCSNGMVSGYARDVNLSGVCTTQCLSDRPSGCED